MAEERDGVIYTGYEDSADSAGMRGIKLAELSLEDIMAAENAAELLDEETLSQIGGLVVDGFAADKATRREWEQRAEEWMEYVRLANDHKQSIPWDGASNIKFPLIAQSAIQFAARAYPSIVKGEQVVKGRVVGEDPRGAKAEKAKALGDHMSYQLLHEMDDWERDEDILLTSLPIMGQEFKKTYRDHVNRRNRSERKSAVYVVMDYYGKSIDHVPRITEYYDLFENEVVEKVRSGEFLEVDLGAGDQPGSNPETEEVVYESGNEENDQTLSRYQFLEQHRWLDLDGDGYQEPYVVIVHHLSRKVVKIRARFEANDVTLNRDGEVVRIRPIQMYTSFPFIPNPDSGTYGLGFGQLLAGPNRTINESANALFDAAYLQNAGGGLIDQVVDIGRGERVIPRSIGEYLAINAQGKPMNQVVYEWQNQGPSPAIFQLLQFMVQTGEKMSAVTDVLTGNIPGTNVPATTVMALIEQGLQVYSWIHKRIHRSHREEFVKLFELNRRYIDEQFEFLIYSPDAAVKVTGADYSDPNIDVTPVSDPNSVTDVQRLVTAQGLMGMRGMGLNDRKILEYTLEAMRVPNLEQFLPDPNQPPPPNPELIKLENEKAGLELENRRVTMEEHRMAMDLVKQKVEIAKIRSEIIKNLAEAESKEAGQQLDQYGRQAELLELRERLSEAESMLQTAVDGMGDGNGIPAGMGGLQPGGAPGMGVPPGFEGFPGNGAGGFGEGEGQYQPGPGFG